MTVTGPEFEIIPVGEDLGPCVRCGGPSCAREVATGRFAHLRMRGVPDCTGRVWEDRISIREDRERPELWSPEVFPGDIRTYKARGEAPFQAGIRHRRAGLPEDRLELVDHVRRMVHKASQNCGGDVQAVGELLDRKAIPTVMSLFAATRVGGALPIVRKPRYPEILRKKGPRVPDDIWEARPSWQHPQPPEGFVSRLDVNAAYLAAMKCYLPYGELQRFVGNSLPNGHAGVHLIDPPPWHHVDLPSPLGNREQEGELWVTTATLRMLYRCAREGLCLWPVIREQWVAPASEGLLEPLREVLSYLRKVSLEEGDVITGGFVKAMYAKFVSTIGQSRHNPQLERPEWEHNIRSQAYANLWARAYKAHLCGMQVVYVGGTDELHVVGDWRAVWEEGAGLAQFKIKKEV